MRSPRLFIIFSILFLLLSLSCKKVNRLPIYYAVLSESLSPEHQAAWNLILTSRFTQSQILDLSQAPPEKLTKGILWLHIPDSSEFASWIEAKEKLNFLSNFYKQGGKILLTNFAARLPHELGVETLKPETKILSIQDEWLFDKKGLQSYRGHPAFHKLFGGTFIWDAYENHNLPTIGYFGQNFPIEGKVVAVEKSYITIHANNKLMIEYQDNEGKILSIGGFIYLSLPNHARLHLEQFLINCFDYLSGNNNTEPLTFWEKYDHQPNQFTIQTAPRHPSICRQIKLPSPDDMVIQKTFTTQNYYDVSGQRALVMGKEAGGIDEFWVHPFRILRDWEVGIMQGDSLEWLKKVPARLEVRPESFTRVYSLPDGNLSETIYPALRLPGTIVHYRFDGNHSLKLMIKYRSDLRWMWPYDENAIGDVNYAYDSTLQALHVKDSAGDLYAVIGADVAPLITSSGNYSDIQWKEGSFQSASTSLNQVYHAALYELNTSNEFQINFGMVGTNTGQLEAVRDYHKLLLHPQKIYDESRDYYECLISNMVTIESPDQEFNKLWKWAIVGTEKFFAHTPGVGTGLLAGYSTTARGWRGNHKISGRPGYAWYFGRDSEWSGFAIDDYGHFDGVRAQLDFLQKFQDLSGKIFHEISTSGVVHYDAADATPLYIILAAHYLRASGDIHFIEKSWPHLKKAMNYLYSTDTDGDLLIENTNEGHGWVEGGELFGAHTTFYLAALWAQTLRDASYMAKHLQQADLQYKYYSDYLKVREILHTDFWNDSTKFFNYGKYKDGSFNPEPTVLPAVAMYFQLIDPSKVQNMLTNFAGNGFSPDWGVRIVSSQSKLFVPTGYHYGSVWPLFTGWTSLAEFRYGHSVQGFTHLMNNLLIKNYWTLGYVEEVINGAVYKPAGVCPHQCWSETNILHPGIHGMIGWQPRAPEHEAILAPRFPLHWDTLRINNLRVGNSKIDLTMKRNKNKTEYRLILRKGQPVKVHFAPEIPAGMVMKQIFVDKKPVFKVSEKENSGLGDTLYLVLSKEKTIEYDHQAGIGVVPFISRPFPEDSSTGYRIIAHDWQEGQYQLELEGASNTFADFSINIFDQQVRSIENAEILSVDDKGMVKIRVQFPAVREKYSKVLVKINI